MCIKIINFIYWHKRIRKICIISTWVIWCVNLCSAAVSDDEWLHEAETLLLDLSVLLIWDGLSLKDLGNLISSGEINLTDLNSLTLSERTFMVHISSLLCFLWQIRLEDLKGTTGCEGETSYFSLGRNNNMLPLCILLSFPSSVNISSIVKSTTELLLNSSNILLLLWVECRDDFKSGSDVAGVVKLVIICGMKEFLLFWLYNIFSGRISLKAKLWLYLCI